MPNTYRYRSFFWPALLILAGVIALLVNAGVISGDRLGQLLDLWPLILIVIGIELILRRSVHGLAGDLAAALVVLLAVAGAVGYVAATPNPSAVQTLDASSPIGNLEQASLELNVGAATINVTGTTDVGSDLYRAHVEYSGAKPQIDFNPSTGRVKIGQPSNSGNLFQTRRFVLTLQLNPGVPWSVNENSGATTEKLDLSHVHVGALSVNTGASRHEITLGPLSGTVPIDINGGALTVNLHRPDGVAAAVAVSGGAVSLTADGRAMHAIGNLTYQSGDFASAVDRYRITVNGGACTVTLD